MDPLSLISALSPVVSKVLDMIPDPNARQKAQAELEAQIFKATVEQNAQQSEINKIEAANSNLFVAGWRPFIGWTCGIAFAFIFVVGPLITWGSTLFGYPVPLPSFNMDALMSLTFGMLGLGALRTFEKTKGVAR